MLEMESAKCKINVENTEIAENGKVCRKLQVWKVTTATYMVFTIIISGENVRCRRFYEHTDPAECKMAPRWTLWITRTMSPRSIRLQILYRKRVILRPLRHNCGIHLRTPALPFCGGRPAVGDLPLHFRAAVSPRGAADSTRNDYYSVLSANGWTDQANFSTGVPKACLLKTA